MRADELEPGAIIRYQGNEVEVVRSSRCPTFSGLLRLVVDDHRQRRMMRIGADEDVELLTATTHPG